MKKYNPEGINLYSGDTSIYTVWNISSIPRYILLDTSGKILAKKMASPDDASVDYVLYVLIPLILLIIDAAQSPYFEVSAALFQIVYKAM